MASFNLTPCKPQSFGYKVSWFAVKAADPEAVLAALEFGKGTPANWTSGLAAASRDPRYRNTGPWVFLSPSISGWVLVVSFGLPYPVAPGLPDHEIGKKFDVLFARLMRQFDDVQFFGSYRVVGFVAWARALQGRPVRVFAYADGDGEVRANIGQQTPEEAKLRFADLSGLSPTAARDKLNEMAKQREAEESALVAKGLTPRDAHAKVQKNAREPFPDEHDVVQLAGLWSIDPSRLSHQLYPPALGLAATLPRNMMQ
jgi:hypothetical protein